MPSGGQSSYLRRLARRAAERAFQQVVLARLARRQQFIASFGLPLPTEQVDPAPLACDSDCPHDHDEDFGTCFHYRDDTCPFYPQTCGLYSGSATALNSAVGEHPILNCGAPNPRYQKQRK